MTIAAVVTAAGRGTRLGSATPKALVTVVGRPLLAYALDRIAPLTSRIVVTAAPEQLSAFGSTACKSLYRCIACREPFEYFKPI